MKVCVVTCTGRRWELFNFGLLRMRMQTRQPDRWLIVTDTGEYPTGIPSYSDVHCYVPDDLAHIRSFDPSNRSLAYTASGFEGGEAVIVMEDDDWYPSNYIERMAGILEQSPIHVVGERRDRRYHVPARKWLETDKPIPNIGSLAFAPGVFRETYEWMVDQNSSRDWFKKWVCDFRSGVSRVSIRGVGYGLPGRAGLRHDPNLPAYKKWFNDPNCDKLREWVGAEDANRYTSMVRT